ncbi:glycosyltransferase [Nesterenkonia alba]|uniref:glycosyltransferase n=1 Tax=Nesterenkonia alba TaxID=515814 RepID=UPI0003B79666|nr:glycosyltransferase [Nesterenkonia alba]
MSKPIFIGHTRFSVYSYGSKSFNATQDSRGKGARFSEQEYADWLYGEERLAPRAEIFTSLSLPQLHQASQDHHLAHFVSFSPSLPDTYKTLLFEAAERYDFLHLNETTEEATTLPPEKLIRRAFEIFGINGGLFGAFRLDDDDLLSVNYFNRMAPYLTAEHVGWWVSPGLGFAAVRDGSNLIYTQTHYYPKSAFGPLCIGKLSETGAIEGITTPKHTKLDRRTPTVLDSRRPMFFHIRHRGQDSSLDGEVTPFFVETLNRMTRRSEGRVELKTVYDEFPALQGHVNTTPGTLQYAQTSIADQKLIRGGKEVSWSTPGPVSLELRLTGQRLRSRELRLRISVDDSTQGKRLPAEQEKIFLEKARLNHTQGKGDYWTWMPPQKDGRKEVVLALEPPPGMRITSVRLEKAKERDLRIESFTLYALEQEAHTSLSGEERTA